MSDQKAPSKLARVGMIVAMLGIMTLILYPVVDFWLFRLNAVSTEGVVVKTEEEDLTRMGDDADSIIYWIGYRFEHKGSGYEATQSVSEAMLDDYAAGDPITVYFDPVDPDSSRVGHSRSTFLIGAVLLFGFGFIWAIGSSLREP